MYENTEKTINNQVSVSGKVASELEFSHKIFGESFYSFKLNCKRLSGTYDLIPVIVSERFEVFNELTEGKYVYIEGKFRSYNKHEENQTRLLLHVFPEKINLIDENEIEEDVNKIIIDGVICKDVIYRETPLKREIADFLLAVNRPYGKSDYIPCITWGRNARWASTFNVSDKVKIKGRIQSREYIKRISEKTEEVRVAYEVSCSTIEKVE